MKIYDSFIKYPFNINNGRKIFLVLIKLLNKQKVSGLDLKVN